MNYISPIELLIKGIPEGLLAVLAIYVISRAKFDYKKYFITSFLYIMLTYVIRLLPISRGVHTLVILLVLILLSILLNKIETVRTIKSAIIFAIIVIISETLNAVILLNIYGSKFQEITEADPITKSISSLPSTLIILVFVVIYYFIQKSIIKRKATNGKISPNNS